MNSLLDTLRAPRLSQKQQALFMQRLSFLISSGMPLTQGLSILESQERGGSVREALRQVSRSVEEGKTLGESMAPYPYAFTRFSIEVIRVGESSGTLAENLEYLSRELRKRAELRTKLVGSLIYPGLITGATILLSASLILFIFPKIVPVFSSTGMELPWSTRSLLAVSSYLSEWGLVTLIAVVAAATALILVHRRYERMQRYSAWLTGHVPVLGGMVQAYHLSNLTRTLSLLLTSGMPLALALPGTARSVTHILFRDALMEISEAAVRGEGMSLHIQKRRDLFPDMVGHMLMVGETSGTLPETLSYVSAFYEAELDERSKQLSTLIEPALMILMGLIVGFVAVSMILPIYGITEHLHG